MGEEEGVGIRGEDIGVRLLGRLRGRKIVLRPLEVVLALAVFSEAQRVDVGQVGRRGVVLGVELERPLGGLLGLLIGGIAVAGQCFLSLLQQRSDLVVALISILAVTPPNQEPHNPHHRQRHGQEQTRTRAPLLGRPQLLLIRQPGQLLRRLGLHRHGPGDDPNHRLAARIERGRDASGLRNDRYLPDHRRARARRSRHVRRARCRRRRGSARWGGTHPELRAQLQHLCVGRGKGDCLGQSFGTRSLLASLEEQLRLHLQGGKILRLNLQRGLELLEGLGVLVLDGVDVGQEHPRTSLGRSRLGPFLRDDHGLHEARETKISFGERAIGLRGRILREGLLERGQLLAPAGRRVAAPAGGRGGVRVRFSLWAGRRVSDNAGAAGRICHESEPTTFLGGRLGKTRQDASGQV